MQHSLNNVAPDYVIIEFGLNVHGIRHDVDNLFITFSDSFLKKFLSYGDLRILYRQFR